MYGHAVTIDPLGLPELDGHIWPGNSLYIVNKGCGGAVVTHCAEGGKNFDHNESGGTPTHTPCIGSVCMYS